MRKIGNTTTGSIIVEMTAQEYEALVQFQGASAAISPDRSAEHGASATMSNADKVTYVEERLRKLSPKKRDAVVRSIKAMFQFTGGIDQQDIERILKALEKRKFFSIDSNGKVSYPKN